MYDPFIPVTGERKIREIENTLHKHVCETLEEEMKASIAARMMANLSLQNMEILEEVGMILCKNSKQPYVKL